MRSLIIFSIALWGTMTAAFAGKTGETLTGEDIAASMNRIQQNFHSKPIEHSIFEQTIRVGGISAENENFSFFATFRPSLNLEVLNCANNSSLPLKSVGIPIEGAGHAGLTKLFSSSEIDKSIIESLTMYKKNAQPPSEKVTIIVEGFSAGAHRAVETAIYLKQHQDTQKHNVVVLRYAGAKTFDDIAVKSIHNLLGNNNIIEFHAKGDSIAEYLDMPNVTTSLGTRIEFSAEESSAYKKRVTDLAFTNMDENFKTILKFPVVGSMMIGMLSKNSNTLPSNILSFLTPKIWELHQPITYAEFCPKVFADFKNKK